MNVQADMPSVIAGRILCNSFNRRHIGKIANCQKRFKQAPRKQRPASAAKDVKSLISAAVGHVDEGQSQVQNAGATISDIISSISGVTQIMEELTAAVEQSTGIEQVNLSVNQMDVVTQQNAALVEQSYAASASLQEQAKKLETSVSVYRLLCRQSPMR